MVIHHLRKNFTVSPTAVLDQFRQFLCPTSSEFGKAVLLFTILAPIDRLVTDFSWFDELYKMWEDHPSQKILNVCLLSLVARIADDTDYQFSQPQIKFIVKKTVQSIEDDHKT
jgi:hypothetical protein